jgi:hypothetical protein
MSCIISKLKEKGIRVKKYFCTKGWGNAFCTKSFTHSKETRRGQPRLKTRAMVFVKPDV